MKNKKRLHSLIISLLLHLILILIFGFRAFDTSRRIVLTKGDEKLPKQKSLVFFTPPPEQKPQSKPPEKKESPKLKPPASQPKAPEQPAQLSVARQTEKSGKDLFKMPDVQPAPEKKETPKPLPKPDSPKKEVIEKHAAPKIKPKKIDTPSPIILPALSEEVLKKHALAKLLKPKPTSPKKAPEKQEPTKPKTIFALAQSTLKSISLNGNSVINRAGDPNKMPTFEELKFISYDHKFQEQYDTTWHISYGHRTFNATRACRVILPLIDRDGNILEEATIIESSGDSKFDSCVIECFKKAAPYPPIPNHFNVDSYRLQGNGTHIL